MISGFVVAYNREPLIETCLRSLRFVDELVVVDKSSTDGTAAVARRYADRVVTVPWSAHVEETRALACDACRGDVIVFLDDDECLSPEAIAFLAREGRAPSADLYHLPCRHHILGRHDPRAYYWPQRQIRAFRRGALAFTPKVHGGLEALSAARCEPSYESGICFHNISHADAGQWVEKMNRYTEIRDRKTAPRAAAMTSPVQLARACIDAYAARVPEGGDTYLEAVAVLRAVYDIVDGIKAWEQRQDETGAARFAAFCRAMGARYDALQARANIDTGTVGRPPGAGHLAPLVPGVRHALADPGGAFVLVDGWSGPERWGRWTLGERAALDLRLPPDAGGPLDLVVSARPYFRPGQAEATVTARLGRAEALWRYRADEPGPVERRLRLEAGRAAEGGPVRLSLHAPDHRRREEAEGTNDRRRFGLGLRWIGLEPAPAGA